MLHCSCSCSQPFIVLILFSVVVNALCQCICMCEKRSVLLRSVWKSSDRQSKKTTCILSIMVLIGNQFLLKYNFMLKHLCLLLCTDSMQSLTSGSLSRGNNTGIKIIKGICVTNSGKSNLLWNEVSRGFERNIKERKTDQFISKNPLNYVQVDNAGRCMKNCVLTAKI